VLWRLALSCGMALLCATLLLSGCAKKTAVVEATPCAQNATPTPEEHPVAPNANANGSDNPQGRAKNRRVEVLIDTCK
jgi:uncharacterized lipoprotein YajG